MQRKINILGFDEVYDICAIMHFCLNPVESYAKGYAIPGYMEEDMGALEGYLKQFSMVSSKFKLLFDVERHGISFLSEYHKNVKRQKMDFDLEEFIKIISEDVDFKKKVISYYIDGEFNQEKDLQKKLLFDCEELDVQYRYMLLQFVEFFDDYMDELFQSMRILQQELKVMYSEHIQLLKKIVNSLDLEDLITHKKMLVEWAEKKTHIQVRFSLINQYLVFVGSYKETEGWMLLGVSYQTRVDRQWKKEISIVEMCNALSDDTRFRIFREVWSNGEITPTLICKKFGLPYSVVGYHLDILKRSRILVAQAKRRGTAYQINVEAVKELSKMIGRFGEK